jgi:polyhydroxybutyrate depolymerase
MRARKGRRAAVVRMAAFLLLLGIAGCGGARSAAPAATPDRSARPAETPAPGDQTLTLDWAGVERTFEVHAPPSYRPGKPLPLVVVLHHRGGTPAVMREMTRFDAKADAEGFLVAYPVGLQGAMNAMVCCGGNDDVGFVRSMVEHLTRVWGVDPARVYATGISNGADMTYRLAVDVPGMFAAIAPVSGGFIGSKAKDPAFRPARPVSVVSFIGSNDRQADLLEWGLLDWHRKANCVAGPQVWADPGKTITRTVAPCADGTEVVGYSVLGMGHAWPGGVAVSLGDPEANINAVDVMWAFFSKHTSGS